MAKLKFKIATPERVVHEAEAESVSVPTQMGEVTILPNHIPLVANLSPGEVKVVEGEKEIFMTVSGGFLEVRPENEIVILADAAEHPEEIDVKRAEEARERARKLMTEKTLGEEEYAQTTAALERSLVRIRTASKRKYRGLPGAQT